MFYEPPKLQGEIRNIKRITNKFNSTFWTCQIFLSERLVYGGELSAVTTQTEAIEAALRLAKRIKKEAMLAIELKAVGEELYVKWVDLEENNNGYKGVLCNLSPRSTAVCCKSCFISRCSSSIRTPKNA